MHVAWAGRGVEAPIVLCCICIVWSVGADADATPLLYPREELLRTHERGRVGAPPVPALANCTAVLPSLLFSDTE